MRITLAGPMPPQRGGIARHTGELYRRLAARAEVQCVSFKRLFPRLLHRGARGGEPAPETNAERVIDFLNPLTWREAAARIRAFRPQAVILPWWTSVLSPLDLFLMRSLAGSDRPKFMLLCHTAGDRSGLPWGKSLTRMVLSRADYLVTECRIAAEAARRLTGPGTKIITLRHPVDAPPAVPTPREAARRRLGLDAGRPLLLFFGYVRKYKGLEVLLEAMPAVARATGAVLVVAGEIWSGRRSLLARVRRNRLDTNALFWDRYASAAETEWLFSACDLVVLPYLKASGSGVFSLAAQYRCPVVASAVGPFGELVEDGITGRLVPPGNPGLLAAAIIESLGPGVLGRCSVAIRRRTEGFSWEDYASRLLEELGSGVRP